jgi:hypothetical protein
MRNPPSPSDVPRIADAWGPEKVNGRAPVRTRPFGCSDRSRPLNRSSEVRSRPLGVGARAPTPSEYCLCLRGRGFVIRMISEPRLRSRVCSPAPSANADGSLWRSVARSSRKAIDSRSRSRRRSPASWLDHGLGMGPICQAGSARGAWMESVSAIGSSSLEPTSIASAAMRRWRRRGRARGNMAPTMRARRFRAPRRSTVSP